MQYQAALQLAQQAPQLYDLPALHRQMLEALGIRDPETLVPDEDEMLPTDPVTENMDFINGEPAKAFAYQDHEAHIQYTHGGNARSEDTWSLWLKRQINRLFMGLCLRTSQEHLAFQYRVEIQKELGIELPSEDIELPPEIEAKLSSLGCTSSRAVIAKRSDGGAASNSNKQQAERSGASAEAA